MKSQGVVLLAVSIVYLGMPVLAQAQWTGSGNDIYNTNSGNVGIGTNSPGWQFDVVNSSAAIMRLLSTANGSASSNGMVLYQNSANGGINVQDNLSLTLATNNTVRMRIQAGGNVGIGTDSPSSKLHVAGDVTVDGNISARYQDLAEWVPAAKPISPGSVVILDSSTPNSVVRSMSPYDTRVAGVISAQPGIVLGEQADNKVKVATTGRVKVRVDATVHPVRIGDLLVTSGKGGTAMKSEPVNFGGIEMHRPGTLIGKALEPLAEGEGEILVLLSLQ